ncbi:hypothetical protein AAG747_20040 [Rapidithrix thailandica]|uniref:Uncharacterized protein n=1 Tax=Rapidithrix thailandica TaxID=413964 RepID=A0AAW9SHQ3_9BACT
MITILFGILNLVLFIAFVVGMIKPRLLLQRFDRTPSRIKVFALYLVFSIASGFLKTALTSDQEIVDNAVYQANNNLDTKAYEDARNSLYGVEKDNKYYHIVQDMLVKIDSTEKADSIAAYEMKIAHEKAAYEMQKASIKARLIDETDSFFEGIDFSDYRGDLELIAIELALIKNLSGLIQQARKFESDTLQQLANTLKKKVSHTQVKELPALRKDYAQTLKKELLARNIEVSFGGKGTTTINFTAEHFIDDQTITTFHSELNEILTNLRFKRVTYRRQKKDSDYYYLTLEVPSDKEVVEEL